MSELLVLWNLNFSWIIEENQIFSVLLVGIYEDKMYSL